MNRRFAAAAIVALCVLPAAPAAAYVVDGKVGVGYEEALLALNDGGIDAFAVPDIRASGLGAWGWIGDFGLEALIGARTLMLSSGPADMAGFLTVGAHYNVFRAPRVNLSTGARVHIGVARSVNRTTGVADDLRVGFGFEIPLRAVYFLSEQFSIAASVGPALSVNGARANPLTGLTRSTELSLFRGGFSGGLGFTVWLR